MKLVEKILIFKYGLVLLLETRIIHKRQFAETRCNTTGFNGNLAPLWRAELFLYLNMSRFRCWRQEGLMKIVRTNSEFRTKRVTNH